MPDRRSKVNLAVQVQGPRTVAGGPVEALVDAATGAEGLSYDRDGWTQQADHVE